MPPVLASSRNRVIVVAAFGLLLVAAAVGLAVGDRGREGLRAGTWRILAVGDDGRSLVLLGPAFGGCDREPRFVVDEHDADRIEIAAVVPYPVDAVACTLILRGPVRQTIALRRPVAGQRIEGRGKRVPSRQVGPLFEETADGTLRRLRTAAPRVVGLRHHDAAAALCQAGFRAVPYPRRGRHDIAVVRAQGTLRIPAARHQPHRLLPCRDERVPSVRLTLDPTS